ncbi:MAG: ATP-binding protein [Paludibacteraceae bacterium]|nr:ATP-binding protein [Paludibacteraceae bacterium]
MIKRIQNDTLLSRLKEPRHTIQVVAGPRQVGKTTMVKQVLDEIQLPFSFFNADSVDAENNGWIASRWADARAQMQYQKAAVFLLVFDEIHKISNWSEQVKKEWDYDTFHDINIKVVLLGSSRLLLKKGLTESLAGRFELVHMGHWSYAEMHEAFGFDINQYIYFGGYPGSAVYLPDELRWRKYMRDSIISPAIEKDVLQTTYIYKPALMQQLFHLGCAYSAELLSYNKMIGQLQEAGNATTLVNYLNVLGESKLLTSLQKFSVDQSRKYRSIPKLQVFNNALLSVMSDGIDYEKAYTHSSLWGRWVESAVGCYLLEQADELDFKLYYWRENNDEVDFVIVRGESVVAIEVKSGRRQSNNGLSIFNQKYHPRYSMVVGGDAMPLERFFTGNLVNLL